MNNILGAFDGMSCGRLAFEKAGIQINKYYASEISQSKIKASKNYFPDNIYVGDIKNVSGYDYDKIDFFIGGSPCQGFSIMGDRLNFNDPRSGLIMDFFRILEEAKPKYFILENVPMDKQCEIEISRRLGVLPVKINSSLVSAQNRKRLYWTNIPGTGSNLFGNEIEQPKDKGILLKDILQPENEVHEKYYLKKNVKEYLTKRVIEKLENNTSDELFNIYESGGAAGRVYNIHNKSCTLKAEAGGGGAKTGLYLISDQFINKNQNGMGFKIDPKKSYTLNTVDKQSVVIDLDKYKVRKLTPVECCRLQTAPDNFFDGSGLSDNQIYSCLGDGWTVDVICHILQGLKN